MKSIQELREERATKAEEIKTFNETADNWTPENKEASEVKFEELTTEYDGLTAEIQRMEKVIQIKDHQETLVDPVPEIQMGADREAEKPFANLAEQLFAIRRADVSKGRDVDKRLLVINDQVRATQLAAIRAAASGMNEEIPSEGGYALQTDFAGMIFESAATEGEILPRVDAYEVGPGANAVNWVEIDEQDVSTTVFGGVRVYRVPPATATTATGPVLKENALKLLKLFGLAYTTEELEQDTTFVSDLYTRAFTLAIRRTLEGEVIDGNGATECLGILNGGDLVSVAKESGQKADTIVYPNLVKMWIRLHPTMKANSAFLLHPDAEEQLLFMEFPVGTGGVPVFLPPGGASTAPYSTLFGRPIVPTDHCSALGDKGDIILSDLSQYFLVRKGGVRSETSIHVASLTDQWAYKFVFRANGQPKRGNPLTIKNSTKTRASNVTLNARA